ncbi:hypothetical protein CHS0354_010515 [Potamilus streckersoni]|uniref:Uncharacterized protein n=1 Tax=Potamilus streckersoni TaxID=2493646 RepID=A0AAE0S5F9_9BIVA|nr:hypothetical protein CHS0354_010515 [Potamilus streckersoni]
MPRARKAVVAQPTAPQNPTSILAYSAVGPQENLHNTHKGNGYHPNFDANKKGAAGINSCSKDPHTIKNNHIARRKRTVRPKERCKARSPPGTWPTSWVGNVLSVGGGGVDETQKVKDQTKAKMPSTMVKGLAQRLSASLEER